MKHKKLDELSREELVELVRGLKRRKKYGLVWEDKPEDVKKIITDGGMKMRKVIHEKMQDVRKKVGLIHHE